MTIRELVDQISHDPGMRGEFERCAPVVRVFISLLIAGKVWGPSILLPAVTPILSENRPIDDVSRDGDCAMDGFFGILDPSALAGEDKKAIVTLEVTHYFSHKGTVPDPLIVSAAIEAVYAAGRTP